jgi:hypothetical protein
MVYPPLLGRQGSILIASFFADYERLVIAWLKSGQGVI